MVDSAHTAYSCYLPVIEFTRGAIVESFHNGAIAVVDTEGRLVAFYGDPEVVSYMRSAAKPFIALPMVEYGAPERFGFTSRELAVTCASHLGMDIHVEVIRGIQQKLGVSEADLLCGIQPVGDAATAQRMWREGAALTPIRHNCSGKHTGMMAQALVRGLPIADYIDPAHPIQVSILESVAEMCGLSTEEVEVAIDGCSVPTFAVPLRNAAFAFARLADPSRGLEPTRAEALRQIFSAMTAHPDMVRGPGDFDTEAMQRCPGMLVSKCGAEAFFGIAVAPGARGPGSPALGISIKIGDGGTRADILVAAELLRQFGVLGPDAVAQLTEIGFGPHKVLKNYRGMVVGEARACFDLKYT